MRILLVDDDTSVIQALLAVLKTLPGHEVKVATTGEKALEHATTLGGVDLLITDVVMDPMDGFTLCNTITERFPGTKTIFISGYDLTEYGDSLSAYQVLQKPISPETLIAAVERELTPVQPAGGSAQTSRTAAAVAQPRTTAALATARASQAIPAAASFAAIGNSAKITGPLPGDDQPLSESSSSSGLIGQAIGGYQILTQLGEGRWGTVYAAVQTSINRPVGLKILDPVRARDEHQKQRFIADARAKAAVQHPSILAVYEAGAASGWIYYTHEYVDGQNLMELSHSGRSLDETTLLKILRVVAEGFIYFTKNNIMHSRLEAEDVYLSVDNQPRLANIASSHVDVPATAQMEIQTLGRALLPLAASDEISTGLRALINRMSQGGANAVNAWGALVQAVKALEPTVVPVEAAQISAQDRAATAAIEAAQRQQKRSLYINLASLGTLAILALGLIYLKFIRSNERSLDAQIEIPAGEFIFGDGVTETTGQFWIDKHEVTIGQYAKFVEFIEKHPEREKDFDHKEQPATILSHIPKNWPIYYGQAKVGGAAHKAPISLNSPMLEVSWWDAYAYAKWKGRELPTEKEWEKAARGTRGFQYPWGEEAKPKNANTGEDYNYARPEVPGKIDGYNYWNDVDKISGDKSPYGVIGMAGNVSEWTADRTEVGKFPIIKGGNFSMPAKTMAQKIDNIKAEQVEEWIGFRTISRTAPTAK
jgi:CheY-like chemotaxis protein